MCPRSFRRSLLSHRAVRSVFALSCAALLSTAHAQKTPGAALLPDSRFDIYAGYGYLHPFDSDINGYQYQPVSAPNVTASVTGWFSRYIGAQAEGGYFTGSGEHKIYLAPCLSTTCDQLVYSAQAGPVARFPLGQYVPFAHVLGGGERSNGPAAQNLQWGWGMTAGVGFDYILPYFNNLFAVRPIQADYHYGHVDHGPLVLPAGITGGLGEMNALKLSAGLVMRVGENGEKKQSVMFGCTAAPVTVYPGEQVTVTGSTLYLDPNPKHATQYTWQSNGGTVTPSGSTATVDTTGLAPGEYTVQGHVSQGSKAAQQASCSAPFSVQSLKPPTISCISVPPSAPSGTPISIAVTGISPDNRKLTYSFSATAGQIKTTDSGATLTTDGLGAQTIGITCNVVDDKGQSASAQTSVTISNPVLPVVPDTQQLCTISFNRDRRRPVRVDNESKACLDDIALTLTQQNSAKLVIIGNASPDEKPEAAAQRALNERQYLTDEKGIDRGRIEVRVGDTSGRTVRNVLVPTGAIFNDANTQTFDESNIARSGQAYGTGRNATRTSRRKSPASSFTSPSPRPQL